MLHEDKLKMKNIKVIKGLSISSTIITSVITISLIVSGIFLLYLSGTAGTMANDALEYSNGIDSNDPGGGYVMLMSLFGAAFMGLGVLLLTAAAIVSFAVAFIYLVPSIVGIFMPGLSTKKQSISPYIVDGVVKTIFNSFSTFVAILAILSEDMHDEPLSLFILIIPMVIEGIAIVEMVLAIDSKNAGNKQLTVNE